MKKYFEQYERVKRWYKRVKDIDEGREHNLPSDFYQDEIYAFFINCYHLKDWIKNDVECHITSKEIERFVDSSNFLRTCGDICNGSKHLRISRPKVNAETHIGKRHFYLGLGGPSARISGKYEIIVGQVIFEAFDLATACLEEWEKFLRQKKLL